MLATRLEDILVVKLGGGEGLDLAASCDDLALMAQQRPLVVVHGVSALANQRCEEAGLAIQTLTSPSGHTSRYTPPAIRDVFVQAAEEANQHIVTALRERGIEAFGLTGDRTPIHGQRKSAIRAVVDGRVRMIRDDYSGSIQSVNHEGIWAALQQGQVAVLPPLAQSPDGLLNIDGDRAAAAIAGSIHAEALIILSNVRGLYRNFPQEDSFIPQVPASQLSQALEYAQGRMKRKVLGAQEALEQGVQRVIIGDGRITQPIQQALTGAGTVFTR